MWLGDQRDCGCRLRPWPWSRSDGRWGTRPWLLERGRFALVWTVERGEFGKEGDLRSVTLYRLLHIRCCTPEAFGENNQIDDIM